jgi:hypothetical protein
MSQHWTNTQVQTALAKTVSDLKPYEMKALMNALKRVSHVEDGDGQDGANESTLGTIFPSTGPNP